MLNWLKEVFGGTASFKNVHNVPRDLVKILAEDLSHLDKLGPRLGSDCLAYVLDGEPQSVIGAIRTAQGVPDALQMEIFGPAKDLKRRAPFYERLEEVPPPVCLRLAKLLAAVPPRFQPFSSLNFSGQVRWPEVLIDDVLSTFGGIRQPRSASVPEGFSFDYIEKLLEEDEQPAFAVIASSFLTDVKQHFGSAARLKSLALLPGFCTAVERHADAIRPVFHAKSHEQRLHALAMLEREGPQTLRCFVRELVRLSTDSSKQVRTAATGLAAKFGADAFPIACDIAREGKPDERSRALRLIWAIGTECGLSEPLDFVRGRAEVEKTRSVLDTIADLQAHTEAAVHESDAGDLDCPPPVVDFEAKLPSGVKAVFDEGFARINRSMQEMSARYGDAKHAPRFRTLTGTELDAVWAYVQGESSQRPELPGCAFPSTAENLVRRMVNDLMAEPGFAAVHAVRLIEALRGPQCATAANSDRLPRLMILCLEDMHHATGHPTLIELQVILEALGTDPRAIARSFMTSGWAGSFAVGWKDEAVWPYFARNLPLLKEWLAAGTAVNRGSFFDRFDRARLFRAIATFPILPAQLVPPLFDLALGGGKADQPLARAALARLPGKEKTIVDALASGKAEIRAAAAGWLGELKFRDATKALETAFKKEKNDLVLGAVMNALEDLGVPMERFLNRAGMADQAESALAKGVPVDFTWFPWEVLPTVHWADSGQPVPPQILKWLLVKACKLKRPEPDSVLRRTCALFDPRGRETFGRTVLEAWLGQDLKVAREGAEKRAMWHAQEMYSFLQHTAQQSKGSPLFGKSIDELYQFFLPRALAEPSGSAIASKGVLAVAAACGGAGIAPVAGRYLKQWYGRRAAQGKALIAMLAWVEHPTATQLMLSVGNRFRTKSFQDEAMRQAKLLADRKGWTVEELADRTIPGAGFDESGEMELDYGERTFVARLGEDFKIELFNPEGKIIAALPAPRQNEDAGKAGEAKKALSAAKKEIKSVVQLQTDRLYEALCTQRTWKFEDWSLYLNRHPIARQLVQRLVWTVMEEGRSAATFRPLDDGTLTDVNDEDVTVSADARIGMAHDTNLDAGLCARWQQHVADYEVAPLFQQFGKGSTVLPEEQKGETEITDFRGHMLEAFVLRGRAAKLGYLRGAAQDAGWFFEYHKRFPILGLQATIEFTGNPLPEENRSVALTSLRFGRLDGDTRYGRSPAALRLGDVPAVLLSECYNDMRLIAAEGGGFDPDWEKKSEY